MSEFCILLEKDRSIGYALSKERYVEKSTSTIEWCTWRWMSVFDAYIFDTVPSWYYPLLAERCFTTPHLANEMWLVLTKEQFSHYLPELAQHANLES